LARARRLYCLGAVAVPETTAAAYALWTAQVAGTAITVGNIVTTVIAVYGTYQAQSKARAAARAQRAAYNEGLTDRTVSVMRADNPWQVIYGTPVVAPAVVALLTSGGRDEFKHLVVVWAAHECAAIEEVYLNGEALGPLDEYGNVTTGRWASGRTESIGEVQTLSATGSLTLNHPPTNVLSVSYNFGSGSGDGESIQSLRADDFDVVGSTVTLKPQHVEAWANLAVQVNYDWLKLRPNVNLRHYLGSDDQTADAGLLTWVPTEWSASDRGRGLCYSVITFDLNEPELQGGPPQVTGKVRGKRVYDPRLDSTQPGGSGAQRVDEKTTWAYSRNVALCLGDFLRHRYGKNARSNQVQWDSVGATANVCDELWAYEDPDQPRYTCDGAFSTGADPDDTLNKLCQAMGGFATFMGTWHVQAGSYTAPVMALTDADNAGAIEVVPAPSGDQVMNGLRGRFYNPDAYDQVTDYTPYINAAFVAEDGGSYLDDLDLPFARSQGRCHQLARIQVERSRGMQLVYPAKMRAYSLKPGQRIALTCSVLGISNSVFRVVKREYAAGQAVKLTLQQDDVSYYDATDAPASLPPPTQTGPNPFVVVPPAAFSAVSTPAVTVFDDDGTVISRARIFYQASNDVLVRSAGSLQVEYRLAAATDWQRHADAPGDSQSLQLRGLQDEQAYVVRARWRNSFGVVSDWRGAAVQTEVPSEAGAGGRGASFVNLPVFKRAATLPATPTGGSFNFDTNVLTPPAGWSKDHPGSTSTEFVFEARTIFVSANSSGTVTAGTWGVPVPVAKDGEDGADGDDGINGQPGAPGAPALAARLSTYAAVFAADSTGLVDAGQSFPTSITLTLGSIDDTAAWAVSRTTSDPSITTTLVGATVTVTGMGTALDTGWVDVGATKGAVSINPLRINLSKAKRAMPASGPVQNPGFFAFDAFAFVPADARAFIRFNRDGTVFGGDGFGTGAKAGDYFLPNAVAVGDAYELRIEVLNTGGNSGGLSGIAPGVWHPLSSSCTFALTTSENQYALRTLNFAYYIRNATTLQQACSGQGVLSAEVEP
jgi:hypothetical protein